MFGRKDATSFVDGLKDAETNEFSSNFKLLSIAAAFLMVTIGLILMQPGYSTEQAVVPLAPIEDLANAPSATMVAPTAESQFSQVDTPPQSPAQQQPQAQSETVTRLDTTLFRVAPSQKSPLVGSQPIRIPAGPYRTNNLQGLVETSLSDFGHVVREGDYLHGMLVIALAQGQSESSIDAMVNLAVARGEVVVPVSLQSYAGRLDTRTLLQAIKTRVLLN